MASPLISLVAVLRGIIPGVEPPLWDLATAEVAPEEGVRVLLEDIDAIPPALAVEVRVKAITCEIGPWATRKGVGSPLC